MNLSASVEKLLLKHLWAVKSEHSRLQGVVSMCKGPEEKETACWKT